MMIGWTTNEVLDGGSGRPDWKTATFVAVLSNLPDLDIAAGLLVHGNGCAFHRGPTHSLVFALLAGVLAANVWRLWDAIPRMRWTSCFFIILSHVIGDLLLTRSPVSLLWPWEIRWEAGFSGWEESLMPIVLEAHRDAGIVLVCLFTIMLVRFAATTKEQTPV
jgi:ABC-type branched-subunit amino acid transport system permease subunit